jgi:HPt (histidine-containing phosphotransfer) domain-containing protein
MTPDSSLNLEAALQRLGGSTKLLRDLARFFIEDHEELLRRLESAVASGDCNEALRAAHSLKTLAANLDAEQPCVKAASEIERNARDGNLTVASSLLPQLKQAAAEFREQLRDLGT